VILSLEILSTPLKSINILFLRNQESKPTLHAQSSPSDQRQAIWIGRQYFPKRNKPHSHIKVWTPLTNKISLHIFTKSKTNFFNTYEDMSIGITWIVFFKKRLFETDVKMVFVFGMPLKFQKFSIRITPCK